MCGICGFIGEIKNENVVIEKMTSAISHRGSDGANYFVEKNIGIGFRYLKSSDKEFHNQPIFSEDDNLVLTADGEIYNYLNIKDQLEFLGHKFYTSSDTEVLVHGFEEWGKEILGKLRGKFAFSIWNRKDRSFFLVRDFFGIKPLYYYINGTDFAYASEIKSILKFPPIKKEINLKALDNYLSFQYVPGQETIFKNIYSVLPCHFLEFKNFQIETKSYDEPKLIPDENLDICSAVSEIKKVVEESVHIHKHHTNSEILKVGCFLSGGVDSSYVTSLSKNRPSFTVGFDIDDSEDENYKFDEIILAKEFSHYLKIGNISRYLSAKEYFNAVPIVQYYMDQPLADPSCIAFYFACKLAASNNFRVILSGEGADELFGGYPVYKEPKIFKFYHKIFCKSIRSFFAKLVKKIPFNIKGRGFIIRGEKTAEDKFIGNANIFSKEEKIEILKNSEIATDPMEFVKSYYDKFKNLDDTSKMQSIDINLWLVGDILLKADRMSMLNSICLRSPFLDKRVFDVARKLPTKLKISL
ncbi:MAG: asparagine synthase (glutamine-hydrolyzing), partial [Firmicutes bacterium]|nr:asparagine synthase (glutamine-hydrolyzing) [Bacillota bacterium]